MLQWPLVALIVLPCALHVVWALLLPPAWRRQVAAKLRPAARGAGAPVFGGAHGCEGCSRCTDTARPTLGAERSIRLPPVRRR